MDPYSSVFIRFFYIKSANNVRPSWFLASIWVNIRPTCTAKISLISWYFLKKLKKFEKKGVIFDPKIFYEVVGISWWNLHYLSLKWAEKHESENRIQLALKTKKLMFMVLWTLLWKQFRSNKGVCCFMRTWVVKLYRWWAEFY